MATVTSKLAKDELFKLGKKSPMLMGLLMKTIPGSAVTYGQRWSDDIEEAGVDVVHFVNRCDHWAKMGVVLPPRIEDLPHIIVCECGRLMEADVKRLAQHATRLESFRRDLILKQGKQEARDWSSSELMSAWREAYDIKDHRSEDTSPDLDGGVL